MSELSELANAYRQFFKGALGKDLLARIDALYGGQLKQATESPKETAWGHLNKAAGVELVRAEIKKVQSMDRKGGGRS